MADITRFFRALSERAYKENDLADITYAMCEADLKFRQYFLDFFFPDARLDAKEVTIEREHSVTLPSGKSNEPDCLRRPDFWITSPKGVFIVEVKIWDGNHHFGDYFKILSKADNVMVESDAWMRLGYIANYASIKDVPVMEDTRAEKVCHVATWEEFVKGIEHYASYDDPIIAAYVEYVTRVCPFDDFDIGEEWNINTSDFRAIQDFEESLKATITDEKLKCKPYKTTRGFRSQQWMGQYFEWTIGGSTSLFGKKVWGWLGVYYKSNKNNKDNGAVVCVEFEDKPGWGDLICAQHTNYVHEGFLRFCAKDTKTALTNTESLKGFFRSVLNLLQGSAQSMDDFIMDYEKVPKEGLSESLIAMKRLPFVLENYLVTESFERDVAKAGYEFSLVHGNDEEVPESHCGRYFELRRKDKTEISKSDAGTADIESDANEKTATYRGWIGVDYNAKCKWLVKNEIWQIVEGKTFAEHPAFVIEMPKDFLDVKDWNENTWGWKCYEITPTAMPYRGAMETVRKLLLDLCKNNSAAE